MDSNGIVAGLDVHKDSVYLCIMGHDESIIFQKTIRSAANGTVSDAQWHDWTGGIEAAMESTKIKFFFHKKLC